MPSAAPDDRLPAAWRLRLLGPAAWQAPGQGWQLLTPKDAALLARLALEGEQPRSLLAGWLWPNVAQPRAHANLRQRLLRLRRGAGELVQESDGVLRLHPAVACDVNAQGCSDTAELDQPLLAGLDGTDADSTLQTWLDDVRRQHLARRADLMLGRASTHESRGELAAALALTEKLLSLDPLLEHAWRRLMQLHSRRGDRAAALAAFERCEQVLRDELGVKPDPETLACLHRVETGSAEVMPAAEGLPASLVRPPRLVGRKDERAAMAAAWQLGSAFVLMGEAGLGKSRLLLDWASAGPGRIIEAARPGDEKVPYAAVVRVLRSLHRSAPRPENLWPDAATAPKVRRELARLLPELGPSPSAPGQQALLMDALETVFRRATAAGAQAVLVDDLHHADEASLAVLQRASAPNNSQQGLNWGFASRPDPRPTAQRWHTGSARPQMISVPGLSTQALQELLQVCKLPGLDGPNLANDLAQHCSGNPFFVLETLRHLMLQGGAAPSSRALPLPPSVEALLAERLQSLSATAQDLSRVAAVAGADLDAELAADVLQLPLLAVAEPWQQLQAAQVLRDDGLFVHDLLRQATLRRLPSSLRRPLHARVANSLRRRGAEPQRVMAHCLAGGLPAEAGEMALIAAARARSLGRLQERLQLLLEAADCFVQAQLPARLFQTRREEVGARYALEGTAPALALLATLLPAAPDRATTVQLHLEQAGLHLSQFDAAACGAAAAAAGRLAEPGSIEELSARLLGAAAEAIGGRAQAAAEKAGPLRERLLHTVDAPDLANLWGYLAMVYAAGGQHDNSIQALQAQHRLAQAAGQSDDEATALSSMVSQYTLRGELELAVLEGRRAVNLQQRLGADLPTAGALLNLAIAQVGLHALHDALHTLQQVHPVCSRLPGAAPELTCIAYNTEAELWLRAQQPQRAWTVLQGVTLDGLSPPRQVGHQAQQARALQALGREAEAQALWRQLLQAAPGSLPALRARLLAALALGPEADAAGAEVDTAAQSAPGALRALACWVQAEKALRQHDPAAALDAVRSLRALLPRARHSMLPESELRQRLCQMMQKLGTPAEATAESLAWQQWQQAVWQPAVRALREGTPVAASDNVTTDPCAR